MLRPHTQYVQLHIVSIIIHDVGIKKHVIEISSLQRGPVTSLFIRRRALHPARNSGTCMSARTALSLLAVCQTSRKNVLIRDER